MKITQEILEALECAIRESGSIYKFAKELGISHSTVFFWKTGKTSCINRQLWNNCLRKKIRPYMLKNHSSLPPEISGASSVASTISASSSSDAILSSSSGSIIHEKKASYGRRPRAFLVLGYKKLACFDPNMKCASDFVQEYALGQFYFNASASSSAFALRIEDDGINDIFTCGTTLLIECGRPPADGELVIAKSIGNSDAKFYIFRQEENSYKLVPYGDVKAEEILWHSSFSSTGLLDWIYPVLEANLLFCK